MRITVEQRAGSSFLFHWLAFCSFSRYNEVIFRVSIQVKICLFSFVDWRTTILFTMFLTTYSLPSKRLSKRSPSFMMGFLSPFQLLASYWDLLPVHFWRTQNRAFWTTLTFWITCSDNRLSSPRTSHPNAPVKLALDEHPLFFTSIHRNWAFEIDFLQGSISQKGTDSLSSLK